MAAAAATPAAGKKKGSSKILMIAIVVVLVVGALFVGKTFLGGKSASGKEKEKPKIEEGVSLPMDEFLVNLSGGGDHYLRATLALGLKKGVTEEQIKEKVPAIRDAALSVLRSKDMKDLTKPDAQDKLKDELKEKINT
ncbi:MAG TPA: flagellar basal body-associated FliL family protein, partial [Chthonomonadaceae bacterium]|nr:flagellar basal body-associated FliL family protein [Chthonomonadaceae bacterium]